MKLKRLFAALAAGAALTTLCATAQAREYSVSTVLSDAFPWGQAAQKWADLVNERSEGRITLRVYHNAQLVAGDQTKEFSAMRSGLIDMAGEGAIGIVLDRDNNTPTNPATISMNPVIRIAPTGCRSFWSSTTSACRTPSPPTPDRR